MIDWKADERHKSRLKRFTKIYAHLLINNGDLTEAVRCYDRTEKQPGYKLKKLLKSKTVQNMITEELLNIYKSKGIDADRVIDEEIELLQVAKANDDRRITLDVLKNWRESLDLKPLKSTTTTQLTISQDLSHLLPSSKDVKQLSDVGTDKLPLESDKE